MADFEEGDRIQIEYTSRRSEGRKERVGEVYAVLGDEDPDLWVDMENGTEVTLKLASGYVKVDSGEHGNRIVGDELEIKKIGGGDA